MLFYNNNHGLHACMHCTLELAWHSFSACVFFIFFILKTKLWRRNVAQEVEPGSGRPCGSSLRLGLLDFSNDNCKCRRHINRVYITHFTSLSTFNNVLLFVLLLHDDMSWISLVT